MSRNNWSDEKLFFRLLNNKTKRTYWDNILELRSRPNDYVFETARNLAKSKIEKEKLTGVYVLAQLGSPRKYLKETLKLFFDLLKDINPDTTISPILYSIGHNNDNLTNTQLTNLISFQDHQNSTVRDGLVFSLLGIENMRAVNTLINLSEDKVISVRNWATFGIGTQIEIDTLEIREALWNRIDDKDEETRFEAIVGLALRKDSRVRKIIERELIGGEFGVLLFDAIEELNDPFFLPNLNQLLFESKADDEVNSVWLDRLERAINTLSNKNETQQT